MLGVNWKYRCMLTIFELAYDPIFVSLLVNLRRGTRANGSSKDNIICHILIINTIWYVIYFMKYCYIFFYINQKPLTEAMIINLPAPAEPPMRATIRLGTIAKHLVNKFLSHGFIRSSRNPYNHIISYYNYTNTFFLKIYINKKI